MSPDAQTLAEVVGRALAEDVGAGDVTSLATVAWLVTSPAPTSSASARATSSASGCASGLM